MKTNARFAQYCNHIYLISEFLIYFDDFSINEMTFFYIFLQDNNLMVFVICFQLKDLISVWTFLTVIIIFHELGPKEKDTMHFTLYQYHETVHNGHYQAFLLEFRKFRSYTSFRNGSKSMEFQDTDAQPLNSFTHKYLHLM